MGRMDIILPDELEEDFRKAVAVKLGLKKGNVSIAVEEAIKEWLANKENKNKKSNK
jgi:hypothetical protein